MTFKKRSLAFEESLEKLEEITTKLEEGELTLAQSLKVYEEGMELSLECKTLLEDAEQRLEILEKKQGKYWEKQNKKDQQSLETVEQFNTRHKEEQGLFSK